jgi:hypothetical protein
MMAEDVDRFCLSRTETAPDSTGNLYPPGPGPRRVHGGWHGRRRERRRMVLAVTATTRAAAAVRAAIMRGRMRRGEGRRDARPVSAIEPCQQ